MTKRTRFLTMLLAAAMAFVMLFSFAYILLEAGHNCAGEECAICRQIHSCENTLKNTAFAGSAAAFAAVFQYILCGAFELRMEVVRSFSLVCLKVKLTD